MPPLPGLFPSGSPSMVPVIRRPPSNSPGKLDKGKAPASKQPPRRQYNDEPLPVKPSTTAPKHGRVVGRLQEHDGAIVGYQVKIGEMDINDVTVDEILDYVSALELEQFEHIKFQEENEILKILEQDREEERKERLATLAEKARTRGAVFVQEGSDSSESGGEGGMQAGKHGRARPDYSQFYKKPRGKGKKIFEDFADEVMVDESLEIVNEPPAPRPGPARQSGPLQELPKRRRRRRDPVTGELLPLDPLPQPKLGIEQKVRQRRKRHPLTGELMPLGWRYDPEKEGNAYENRREGLGAAMKASSLAQLSLSEHPAKRPRLDSQSAQSRQSSSASPVPTKAEIMGQASSQTYGKNVMKMQGEVVDLMSSSEEEQKRPSPPKRANNSMMQGTVGSTASSSSSANSPQPITSITRPTATTPPASQRTSKVVQRTTSIMSPSAARTSSMDPLAIPSEDDDVSDDEVGEGEWYIESILGHRMSDPKTHPTELGKQPVMLYSVKWEGYDEPTWEPMESFGDRSMVDEYRKKVRLARLAGAEDEGGKVASTLQPKASTSNTSNTTSKNNSDDEDAGEPEYEVEHILAHHLSDPRTHPGSLGKTPVMLYHVKWKGFTERTWEPEGSFDDNTEVLRIYKRKKGLR